MQLSDGIISPFPITYCLLFMVDKVSHFL